MDVAHEGCGSQWMSFVKLIEWFTKVWFTRWCVNGSNDDLSSRCVESRQMYGIHMTCVFKNE